MLKTVCAADITALDVTKQGSRVFVHAELIINAPLQHTYDALIDFNSFSEWSPRFSNSGYLGESADGRPQAQNDIAGCVLFFCKKVERVVLLTLDEPHYIGAEADPERSDVQFGLEQWWLEADGDTTRVTYRHEIEFEFWIPPVIGVWAMRHALHRDGMKAAKKVESMVP